MGTGGSSRLTNRLAGGAPDVFKLAKLAIYLAIGWWLWHQVPSVRQIMAAPRNVVYGVTAGVELHNLQKVALVERVNNGRCPSRDEFAQAVDRRYVNAPHDPLLDPWKRYYQYYLLSNGFELRSAGPDGRLATTDDLVVQWKDA